MNKKKKLHKINGEIRATEVRVADEGIMSLSSALRLAESKELDLVLLNENNGISVCKLMNYEKFIYQQNKKQKQKTPEVKEIKFGPNTSENDVEYRIKHIIEFLQKNHKVKLTLQFKGREIAYLDKGNELILRVMVAVEEYGIPEALPVKEGKKIFATIKPKTNK